jgi:hypothetical protein
VYHIESPDVTGAQYKQRVETFRGVQMSLF